ncbi:tetratricopeptide repeat protein [Kitasatospora purpeofusca]|uniref:tetratricopeptide repeat protein n=1 Tax=Kitasatospora purpeofusca TaxID=67352 RepID=UPI0036A2E8F7
MGTWPPPTGWWAVPPRPPRSGERVLADRERVLGEDHPDTVMARAGLAVCYREAGRIDGAIKLLRSVAKDRDRVLGPEHPDSVLVRADLATVLTRRGRGLLPDYTPAAWRDAAEAVQAVGSCLSVDPVEYGPALTGAYELAAAVLDADGQPEAAADFRSRAHRLAATAPPADREVADGSRS